MSYLGVKPFKTRFVDCFEKFPRSCEWSKKSYFSSKRFYFNGFRVFFYQNSFNFKCFYFLDELFCTILYVNTLAPSKKLLKGWSIIFWPFVWDTTCYISFRKREGSLYINRRIVRWTYQCSCARKIMINFFVHSCDQDLLVVFTIDPLTKD